MNYFTVDVLTPNAVLAKNIPVEELLIPTTKGQINVLPEHTHMVTKLDTGILSLFGGSDDPDRHFSVTTGICKVLNERIVILASTCEESHEVDRERAERALRFAEEKLNHSDGLSNDEVLKFRRKVERARLRIQLTEQYK